MTLVDTTTPASERVRRCRRRGSPAASEDNCLCDLEQALHRVGLVATMLAALDVKTYAEEHDYLAESLTRHHAEAREALEGLFRARRAKRPAAPAAAPQPAAGLECVMPSGYRFRTALVDIGGPRAHPAE